MLMRPVFAGLFLDTLSSISWLQGCEAKCTQLPDASYANYIMQGFTRGWGRIFDPQEAAYRRFFPVPGLHNPKTLGWLNRPNRAREAG